MCSFAECTLLGKCSSITRTTQFICSISSLDNTIIPQVVASSRLGFSTLGLDYYDGKINKTTHSKAQVFRVFHQQTYIHTYMGLHHIPNCAFWFQLKEDFYFTMLDALLYLGLHGTKQISQKIFLLPLCLHFLKYLNCKSHKSYLSYHKLLHVPKHTNACGLNLTNTLSN